ncbi:MAG: ATP-binding protein [Pseudomonadota bacterium]
MQPTPTQHFAQSRPVFYRRLALAGIVALALIQAAWWTRGVPEPLWISGSRMLCLGFLIIFYAATWLSAAVARRGDLGIYGALLLLTGHLSLTLYVSNIDLIHGFAALTVNTIAALVMFRVWQIMTITGLSLGMHSVAALLASAPEMPPAVFIMLITTYCGFTAALSSMRLAAWDRQQRQQAIHSALFSHSLDGLIYGHAPTGEVYAANPAALKLLETTDPQLAGNLLNQSFREHFGEEADAINRAAFAGDGWRGTYPSRTATGRRFWADVNFSAVELGGQPLMMVQFVDGTERMDDAIRLKEMQILLARSQAMARVGGWQYELAERRWFFTPSARHILRMPEELAHPYRRFLAGDRAQRGAALQAFRSICVNGEPFDLELDVATWQGRPLLLRVQGEAIVQHGQVTKIVGVFSDITERQERERALRAAKDAAEEAAKARSQFLANMSHEIRTPMNGVIGMASLLMESALADEHKRLVATINSSGEALLRIINEILDFSKIDAGEMTLDPSPFDLRLLLQDTAALFRPLAEREDLVFEFEAQGLEDAPPLLGDEVRLRQIITNLLSNAIKFTETGSVTMQVRLSGASTGAAHHLSVAIRDSGIGIPADRISSLFEPFAQADASITRRYGGTGLGLSICKQLTELMQGTLNVVSTPGRGSTFTLTVPLPQAQAPAGDPSTRSAAAPSPQLSVLLVEDNRINQAVALRMLKKLNVDADLAENGRQAIEQLKARPYDLIFMDMQMPEIDGLEATRLIRLMDELPQPHIVAMTANALEEDRQQCLEAGMNDFIAKPIRLEDIRAVLATQPERLKAQSPSQAS